MAKWKRDVIYGGVILAFCVGNYIYAGTITQTAVDELLARPDSYMKMWLIVLGALAVAMILRAVLRRDAGETIPIFTRMAVFTVAVFFVYLLAMPRLGFFLATFLFLSATVLVYSANMGREKKTGRAKWLQAGGRVGFALGMTFLVELLFRYGLSVVLPTFRLW